MANLFDSNRVVFVTGKGGVGKSTVAGALALSFARKGERVLLAETDTYSALEEAFGVELSGPRVVSTSYDVDLVNLRTSDCLEHTLNRFVPGERIARAVVNNRVAGAFFDAAPSVSEFVLLNRIFELSEGGKGVRKGYDKIVVDLPASGHAVTFLSVPKTLNQMMRGVGPVATHAREIAQRIENKEETAIVAVCIPEEMPVSETIELSEKLEGALARPLSLVVANMVHDNPVSDAFATRLKDSFDAVSGGIDPSTVMLWTPTPIQRLLAGNELARRWHGRDTYYLNKLHEQLRSPVVEIPRRYVSQPFELLDKIEKTLQDSMAHLPTPTRDQSSSLGDELD